MTTGPASADEFLKITLEAIQKQYPDARLKHEAREEANRRNALADGPVLYGEGDSWFDFPWWIIFNRNCDILNALQFKHGFQVERDALAGDWLEIMSTAANREYLHTRMQELKPAAFLLSGGGNDFFGARRGEKSLFFKILRENNPEDPIDLELLEYYLAPLMQNIADICQVALRNGVPAIIHGYAVTPAEVLGKAVIKFVRGPWIEPVLDERGYEPKLHGEKILGILVDTFNSRLCSFAEATDGVEYVDLRPCLRDPRMWHDETHLYSTGWKAAAQQYVDVLRKLGVGS